MPNLTPTQSVKQPTMKARPHGSKESDAATLCLQLGRILEELQSVETAYADALDEDETTDIRRARERIHAVLARRIGR